MRRLTSNDRVELCRQIYGDKYDYLHADFSRSKEKTCVICKIHGTFYISFDKHYNSLQGCPKCAKPSHDTPSFIERAKQIHGDKYDYSSVRYKSAHDKVEICCKKHGKFLQTPNAHLNGQGCPKCAKNASKLEDSLRQLLTQREITFQEQFCIVGLENMPFDFFIPKANLLVECQGKQHFGLGGWTRQFDFQKQIERDKKKHDYAMANGYLIAYYAEAKFKKNEYFGEIISSKDALLELIEYLLVKNKKINVNKL